MSARSAVYRLRFPVLVRALHWCAVLCLVLFSGASNAGDIKVYAAASLTDALNELAGVYEKQQASSRIKTSYTSSSTLAKQIENGAPADLFLSADSEWANYLQARNLLDNASRVDLLYNQLVFIVPSAAELPDIHFSAESDFAASFSGKLCTGDTSHVPVGKYAKQALSYYGWWQAIEPRLVGAPDVRSALAFVERGECGLGIVYKTDALMSDKVKIVASFPSQSHPPVVYPGSLTAKASAEAKGFWQFLQSPEAASVFERYGFTPVSH